MGKELKTDAEKQNRIKELIEILNNASYVYYQKGNEVMSNYEYDELYDELVELEKETGFVMANSPTVNVGYEVVSELPKEKHESSMLSLNKTKEVAELQSFIGNHKGIISWKLDGLTVVLTYNNGELVKAVTRGNGDIGELITANAKTFKNIPLKIAYKDELIIRGEAVIRYSDFEKINDEIGEENEKYKNPRNLCSGSVRQLNSEITAKRNVNFYAFALIKADGVDFNDSINEQFSWLESQGFQVVEHFIVTKDTVADQVDYFSNAIKTNDLPSDGLVLMFDGIEYGKSLGTTAKFPRNGIAFKWQDETATTKLLDIEWSASRTGLINPVAIFEPVELEGTTVSRASVHNVSIAESLQLGIGDTIEVYKANMIIPQIAVNQTKSGLKNVPEVCPICGEKTKIKNDNGFKFLYCVNPKCPAKQIKRFANFVSRSALNIQGLSEETLEKFVDSGYIKTYGDIFKLDRYQDSIVNTKGFGETSFKNYIEAIDAGRNQVSYRVLAGLGIAGVGLTNARNLMRHLNVKLEDLPKVLPEDLEKIDGVGSVMANAIVEYFSDKEKLEEYLELLSELNITYEENINTENAIAGKTFVITGSLNKYDNRDALKEVIDSLGGKVTGSVTKKTDYLINNDIDSTSSKNKKAKELGIPIITEEDFDNLKNS